MSTDVETEWRLPRWLAVLVLAVFALAHTQVTLRHLALRAVGVQYGYIGEVLALPTLAMTQAAAGAPAADGTPAPTPAPDDAALPDGVTVDSVTPALEPAVPAAGEALPAVVPPESGPSTTPVSGSAVEPGTTPSTPTATTAAAGDRMPPESVCVLVDPLGTYGENALVGDRVWVGDASWPVLANTATTITLGQADDGMLPEVLGSKTIYYTGVADRHGLVGLALRVPGLPVTLADGALGLATVLLAGWLLLFARGSWRLAPVAVMVLLAVGFWSLVEPLRPWDTSEQPTSWRAGIKEWIQQAEVLFVGLMLFRVALQDRWLRRALVWTGLALAVLMVGSALWEYAAVLRGATPRGLADLHEVDGLWGFRWNPGRSGIGGSESSRNILAVWSMLMTPVLLAGAMIPRRWWWRVPILVLAALSLLCILSLAHLVAALAGCLLVAALWRQSWAVPAVLGGAVTVLVLACTLVPQHGPILLDSTALRKLADPYGALPMPLKGETSRSRTAEWGDGWQQKYMERQASLQAVAYSPLVGLGLGHYQERINQYYTQTTLSGNLYMMKPDHNAMEKDAHGQYFITAVETGVLGVAALVWVLVGGISRGVRGSQTARDPWDAAVCLGLAGGLLALALGGFVAPLLVRGLSILLVVAIAYTYASTDTPRHAEAE